MSCCLLKEIPPCKKTKIVDMKSYRCRRTEASSHSKSGTKSKCDRNGVVRKKEKLCVGTTYLRSVVAKYATEWRYAYNPQVLLLTLMCFPSLTKTWNSVCS